jgi:glycosyltransferase involved in cell wall biosynthesis
MRLAVCVITFHRPIGLRRLLESLNRQVFNIEDQGVHVFVVDNDANESARDICHETTATLRWPLNYSVEKKRGISFARNTAVSAALKCSTPDFIAFIDDDETAEPSWLEELLAVQLQHNADVVTGPIVSRLPSSTPQWIASSRAFKSIRRETGIIVDRAYTHNVLVRSAVFKTMKSWFDPRLALTGGEDSHFFRRAHNAGFKIVWADRAVANEWIPESRATAKWILQRAYRVGNSRVFIEDDLRTSSILFFRLRILRQSAIRFVAGVALIFAGFFKGRSTILEGLRTIYNGIGLLAGLAGRFYREYLYIHGE